VPGVNISRSEAKERAEHLAVCSYDVSLDLTHGNKHFIAKTVARFTCSTPGYNTFIDAVGHRVISATLNGGPVDTSNFDGETIYLKNLAADNELVIEIENNFSDTGEGLQLSVDPADNEVYVYSQGETAYTRKMFPCFDQPSLKAIYTLTAIVPAHWEAISNSPVVSKSDDVNGARTWLFAPTPRIATYIMCLIAGPYFHVHDEYTGSKTVPLGIYCRKSLADKVDKEDIFDLTKQGFSYFENTFGLAYPFEKYDQIAVVDFNWGAMENSGAVTFKEELLVFRSKVTERMYSARANVILHEMAHMWFGNMVTMHWWDDLWLNESFAEWSSYLALAEGTRFTNAWTGFNVERKNWAYRQDQLISTHPIITDMVDIEAVNANFDGISYAKGASVLQQMIAHVGRDNFIKGLKNYFDKHAWQNTTLDDLLIEVEATSGRDLKNWVHTWFQTAGVNTLRPVIEVSDGHYQSVAIAQEAPLIPAGSTEIRPHRMAVGLYDTINNELVLRRSVDIDATSALTSLDALNGEKAADLLLLNDRDISYAKIRFDEGSIITLKSHLGTIKDPLARALCWSALWDMTRDAELAASDFVTAALAALGTESDITTVSTICGQIGTAVDLYAHPSHRDSLRELVAIRLYEFMNAAASGSDHQLTFARAFSSMATTNDHATKLRAMLDGAIPGLVVDSELRWIFVHGLAEIGAISRADIDAEKSRDNTFSGQYLHARAIASLRDAGQKQATYSSIAHDDLTNTVRQSAIVGFQRPSQRDLLASFVDAYFADVADIWAKKSFEIGSSFAESMYPTYITEQSTIDKTDAWLASEGKSAPAGLVRAIAENRDAMARALRNQAKDA
jgi:aminopeptidase N